MAVAVKFRPVHTARIAESMTTLSTSHVDYMAHHYLLLALPAFLPAVIVVGVVLYVALRDRRRAQPEVRPPADDKPT